MALGGNALLERGEAPDSEIQEKHVLAAAEALAPLAREHELVITHGNGPQIGLLAIENESDPALSRPYPFDVLGAQTQGMIGYWLVQALHNVARLDAVCVLSRTLVHADDPALAAPSKFVGPVYDEATARRLAAERGWRVARDGARWRRVVPSPEPAGLVELPLVRHAIADGTTVVCGGGGGIPVVRGGDGGLTGVEAVVDKDFTAELVARELGADALLLLTDVEAVQEGFGTPEARPISRISSGELGARSFPAGSMGPKVTAACRFVDGGGRFAAIGRLADAPELAVGTAGTVVTP
ncbi:carbamate kinase [Amycolatopsis dongchuanensis]|uniref:Carbamate kinase n=1 Tax=Amycolatopsis dongchuanensis TaxID=1070866 RepID=A0ABP9QTL3_9PSEU